MSLEDYYGAIEDFNKAILLNPNYSMAYLHRGECKFFLDDGSCYGDFNKCLEIDSKNAECYYYRGLTLIDSGQKKEGCLDLSKAGELGDEDAYEAIRKYCND